MKTFKQKHHKDCFPAGRICSTVPTCVSASKEHTHKLENVQISISKSKLVAGASACCLKNRGLLKISMPGQRALHVGPCLCQRAHRLRHLCTHCHHICLIKISCRYVLTPFYLFIFSPADVGLHTDDLFLTDETDVCWWQKQSFECVETWNESHKHSFFLHIWFLEHFPDDK